LLDIIGMLLIGDGVLSVLRPRRHCLFWAIGPEPCREVVEKLAANRELARAAGLMEIMVGVWLASTQEEKLSLWDQLRS